MRAAPDGGTANGIWGPEFDDGAVNCPDCGEHLLPEEIGNVESFERFETNLCADCFVTRCEAEEDDQ